MSVQSPSGDDNPWAAPPPSPPVKLSSLLRGLLIAAITLSVLVGGLAIVGFSLPRPREVSSGPAGAPSASATAVPASAAPVDKDAAGPVTASSPVTASGGTTIFTDTFDDAQSGWPVNADADNSKAYTSAGYRIRESGAYLVSTPTPYEDGTAALSQSVTVRLSSGSPFGSAMGLSCGKNFDQPDELDYQFSVTNDGGWQIERLDKANDPDSPLRDLIEGALPQHGTLPLTVTAVCATLADQRTTRLVLFINGVKAADVTDRSPAGDGLWRGMLLISAPGGGTTAMTVRRYSAARLGQ